MKIKNVRHGHVIARKKSRTYNSWTGAKARCNNINGVDYLKYGGRGITICERWLVFDNFLEDMGERPEGMTLDRIDNNGNYEPSNCRWATYTRQNFNQKLNKRNSSGFRGVGFNKSTGKFRARININKKERHLGYFNTIEEAIQARVTADKEYLNERT